MFEIICKNKKDLFEIECFYIQIYNDHVHDLLHEEKKN